MIEPRRLVTVSGVLALGPVEAVMQSVTLTYETGEAPDMIDITADVAGAIEDLDLMFGTVIVFSQHTTAAIRLNENEGMLKRDIAAWLDRIVPKDAYYHHNDFAIRTENMTEDESPNGHSHIRHLVLGTSEIVPVVNGRLHLGQWQRLFLIELDRPRKREVLLHIFGAAPRVKVQEAK